MRQFKRHFHLDFETFSECDIRRGVKAYATDPTTEILLAAYAYDDNDPYLWDAGNPVEHINVEYRRVIEYACKDPDTLLIAWNVPFEREILRHVWGIETPPEKWLDAMVVAYTMSLPGNLGDASRVLQLPDDQAKQAIGKKLIQKFSKLQPKNQKTRRRDWTTDPEDWDRFGEYCVGDVIAERAALKRMWKFRPPEHEFDLWHLDQKINDRGAPIDLDLVYAAQEVTATLKDQFKQECAVLTGLDNPNSREQFLEYIRGEGYPFDSLTKDKVDLALREHDISDEGKTALALRSQFSKNSTAKYSKIEQQQVDGWLSYILQYSGAGRTWRWAGRGAQFHNLPRPPFILKKQSAMATAVDAIKTRDPDLLRLLYDEPIDVLAGAIRPTLRAPESKKLVISDYNAIENRVLGWVARCDAILNVFRHGLDPYKDFGLKMFHDYYGKPGEPRYAKLYDAITGQQRTDSKPAVLGAGYMLGGGREMKNRKTGEVTKTGLWAYSEALGVDLSREQAHHAVKVYRDTYPEVVDFWDEIDAIVRRVIHHRHTKPVTIPVGFSGQQLEVGYKKPFMYIKLPSGRRLWYFRPAIERVPMPWENDDGSQAYGMGVTYWGLNQTTNKWCKIQTHKGKLTENIVQAIARDILANGLIKLDDAGFDIVLHVHDEVVTLVDVDDETYTVDYMNDRLCDLPDWALDMPMRAEGLESPFYVKD